MLSNFKRHVLNVASKRKTSLDSTSMRAIEKAESELHAGRMDINQAIDHIKRDDKIKGAFKSDDYGHIKKETGYDIGKR